MKRSLRLSDFALLVAILLAAFLLAVSPSVAQEGADPETLAEGARIYQENCLVCHGELGEGRVGATLSKDWPAIRPDLRVRETIANGVAGSFMPPWIKENGGPLDEGEIDSLVAYILSWQSGEPVTYTIPEPTARPPIEPIPEVAGDPNRGAVLYDENCAVCHGPDGQGRVGATLAKDWPAIRTDLQVRDLIVNGVPGSFMPYWSQEKGGPLTDGEIDDMVAFILSLSPEAVEVTQVPSPVPTSTNGTREGSNTGLIISAVVLVLIIIGGVLFFGRNP